MAKYRKVSPSIWNDAKFRNLSDNAKLTFFMLLTHPQTSSLGSLRAYQEGLAREMKWSLKAFREAFGEVLAKGMVKVDEEAGLIWLPNFMKHNSPESPNVVKSWLGAYEDCPECQLKNEIYYAVKDLVEGLGKGFREAFAKGFGKTMPNQEQEQEQEQNILCAEPSDEDSTQEPSLIDLPLVDGTNFPVTETLVNDFSQAYPAVDVMGQLHRMKAWLVSNPQNRKTPKGIKRFLNSWLAKAQDSAPRKSQGKIWEGAI